MVLATSAGWWLLVPLNSGVGNFGDGLLRLRVGSMVVFGRHADDNVGWVLGDDPQV